MSMTWPTQSRSICNFFLF